MQETLPAWRRWLRSALTILATLLLIAVFYVAVVMGQPQDSQASAVTVRIDQPLLPQLPAAVRITDEKEIDRLTDVFPAPVLHAAYGRALVFVEGVCSDLAWSEGLGRVVTLTYRTETFDTLTVSSIYPARALELIGKGDYTFTGRLGQTIGGLRTVPMQNSTTLRLHAQGEEALYVLTAPQATDAVLRQWTSAMQLYQPE